MLLRVSIIILTILSSFLVQAQDILPPTMKWKGKSTKLVVKDNHPWITPSEQKGLTATPDYDETNAWLKKITDASPILSMISVGKSEQNRDIMMVIASTDDNLSPETLKSSKKPLLLAHAGIHAGEIDGKDAGMMLLRDIAFNGKGELLDKVNLLFIPILNVDGHERSSPYNRVNQRGPANMGWRTNAQNLNLNRDYAKLETAGVKAIVNILNSYDPDLYLDLHVTDGADYQYDITYGWATGYSPAVNDWIASHFKTGIDQSLTNMGHTPGPLMFAFNGRDFSQGNTEFVFSPRFSDTYGMIRNTPSILIENHSLKPYKQRVLGTYVFLEASLKVLANQGAALQDAIEKDRKERLKEVVLSFALSESVKDSMLLKGIEKTMKPSEVVDGEYVSWTGKPYEEKIVMRRMNQPDKVVQVPKAYWIPVEWQEIIQKLRMHGIEMEEIKEPTTVSLGQYFIESYELGDAPFEGQIRCTVKEITISEKSITYLPGSVRVPMDQYKGQLAALLLEPESPDSFLQWGFMHSIFSRTEYIEQYAIEPLAQKMLAEDPELKTRFEQKKKDDPEFANSPRAIYQWFYAQSPYFDQNWKWYPVGKEM